MDSNILDYIILALLFVIIIHIFIQTFGKKEHLRAPQQNTNVVHRVNNEEKVNNAVSKIACKVDQMDNDVNKFIYHNQVKKHDYENMRNNVSHNIDHKVNTVSEHKLKCPVSDMDNQTDQYIRKTVLRGSFDGCSDSESEQNFSNKEILEYQNDFFGFNDKINFGSSDGLDPVDKMNEMQVGGNNELGNMHGQRISDVYASLTQ